ncbi:MAG: DUF2914 domain-containing protein [Nitrospirota bacterium]|nr:DUF2914 domain-containing protein [Nitrospirota bacterium]
MTKPLALLGPLIIFTILVITSLCWAEPELLEIALARNIKNRNPISPHSPIVSCEKNRNHDAHLPIINASTDDKVVFWNRVMAKSPATFHHIWHKKTSDGWKNIAHVSLKVRKSSSFRTWSTKTIYPGLHIGEWMIVVSVDNDLKNVLCIVRFIIK